MIVKELNFSEAKFLIIDDDVLSANLVADLLEKAGYKNITITHDPTKAHALYQDIQPDLVILDLHMPMMSGFEVMEQLRGIEGDSYLPIIILSSEEDQAIRFRALKSGAKDILNKPYDRVEVLIRIRNLLEVRMLHNAIRDQNKILEERVKERTQELSETQVDVVQRLARAIEYRDSETGMHILRMSHYSACLAGKVGLNMDDCELIFTASPLHDVGKIGIPDNILGKPGPLTDYEWNIMKTHTTIGAELLAGGKSKFMKMAREIAMSHHERWDGKGYPQGLKAEEIPIVGRICGLCDVFDALLTKRPYKPSWTLEATVDEIKKNRGAHFDPGLVDCFLEILPQLQEINIKYVDQHKNYKKD